MSIHTINSGSGRPIILNSWLDILDMTVLVEVNGFTFRVVSIDQKKIKLEPTTRENSEKMPWSECAVVGEYIRLERRNFQITKIDLDGEAMFLKPKNPPKESHWYQAGWDLG
jgi:hypothetical protein